MGSACPWLNCGSLFKICMDRVTKEKRSEMMSAIKGKGNLTTEVAFMKILKSEKITGWRSHYNRVEGRPDFAFPKKKLAIFIDGCFWHGCKKHGTVPNTNVEFWEKKIEANKQRDKRVDKSLKSGGWRVLRIWEHETKKNDQKKAKKIAARIK